MNVKLCADVLQKSVCDVTLLYNTHNSTNNLWAVFLVR